MSEEQLQELLDGEFTGWNVLLAPFAVLTIVLFCAAHWLLTLFSDQ